MSRPVDTLPTVSAALARVLAGKRPAWVSLATWMALRSAVEDVADDARAATREFAERPAAAVLGCGQGSLRRWREPGGWLSE